MPSKYSHAFVLSHYQSRGLIKFPQAPSSPYVALRPVESSSRVNLKSRKLPTDDLPQVDKSRHTSVEPAVTIKPASSHQSTPSIITEINAPERTSSPLQDPPRPNSPVSSLSSLSIFSLDLEFDDEFSSGTNSLTTSTSARSSSFMRSTPRSSISPILESSIFGPSEDSPSSPGIYPTVEDYAAKPWDDLKTTPAVFHLQSLDSSPHYQPSAMSPSARSPSPDDATPPPITLYRPLSPIPVPKRNRTLMSFTKSSRPSLYPDTAPVLGRNSYFDRQRVKRSALSHRFTGGKLWQ
ncbi:hypothetical protein MMC29_001614 [Sticta canariensis]|nr:hypothetical protein [Sticta canariensis]